MFCFVSPAKKMNFDSIRTGIEFTDVAYPEKTKSILKSLQKLSEDELKKLMKLSDSLASLNAQRFKDFDKNPRNHAIFAFSGDTYVGLDAKTLSDDDLNYAQNHFGMLSGLYGLLRPFDGIKPYRMEMGSRLNVDGKKDLYDFWGDDITDLVNQRVKECGAKAVVNLASNEYVKAIDAKKLDVPFIDIDFKEIRDGVPKTIGLFAKRARGMMARYIIQNRLSKPQELKEFDWKDYEFDASVSTENKFVFKR